MSTEAAKDTTTTTTDPAAEATLPVNPVPSKENPDVPAAFGGKKEEPAKEEPAKEGEKKEEVKQEVKYELKAPKDSLLGEADLERIVAKAKARGLSAEAAQALVEDTNEALMEYGNQQKAAFEKSHNEWRGAIKKKYGEKLPEVTAKAERAYVKYVPETLRKWLHETGFGDIPDVFEMFVKLGEASAEDKAVGSNAPSPKAKKQPWERLYEAEGEKSE